MKHRYRITLLGFILLLLGNFGLSLINPAKASAAVSGDVIDRATIKVGDKIYIDGNMDDNFEYTERGSSDGCPNKINGFNNDNLKGNNTPQRATFVDNKPAGAGSDSCDDDNTQTINFNNRGNFLNGFVWYDGNTIKSADGILTFNKRDSSNIFEGSQTNGGGCRDTLTINAGNQTATLVARQGDRRDRGDLKSDDYDWFPFARPSDNFAGWNFNDKKDCWESRPVNGVRLGGTPKEGSKGAAGSGAVGSASQNAETCENQNNSGSLSWIICPVITLMDNAVGKLDEVIQEQLETKDLDTIRCSPETPCPSSASTENPLKSAWGQVRNLALIILIPIMLIMVIGTAIGYSGIDAYTVKRAMPRLLIAVLFITLSWSILAFLINITNVVGRGIEGIITQPFGGPSTTLSSLLNPDKFAVSGITGLTVFGTLWLGGSFSIGIVFSLILVALVALLLGFFILVVRQVLIFGLLLLAPLAILAWIFPGNDKLWKIWWGTFTKLLLLYPLIMLLIGAGKAFASIIPIQQGDASFFTQVLIIIAYVAPFFFIPAAFRFAGGVFANLAGIVNDRGRGFFDKQREKRAKTREGLRERAGANRRFNPNNRLTSKFNSAASWAADPYSNLAYKYRNVPGLSGTGQKIKSHIDDKTINESAKLFEELNNAGFNDKAYRALAGVYGGFSDGTKEKLRANGWMDEQGNTLRQVKSLKDIQDMASILEEGNDTERIGANVLLGSAGRLTSLYSDPEMLKANTAAAGAMGLSAHGFASSKDLAQFGNNLVKTGAADNELAQALVSRAQVAGQRQRPDVKAGYGTVFRDGKFQDGMKEGGRAINLLETISQGDIVQAKSGFIKDMEQPIKEVMAADTSFEGISVMRKAQAMRAQGHDEDYIKANLNDAEKKVYQKARLAPAIRDEMFLAASSYSQSSTDTKVRAKQIIEDMGLSTQFQQNEERINRQRLGEGGGPPEGEGPAAGGAVPS